MKNKKDKLMLLLIGITFSVTLHLISRRFVRFIQSKNRYPLHKVFNEGFQTSQDENMRRSDRKEMPKKVSILLTQFQRQERLRKFCRASQLNESLKSDGLVERHMYYSDKQNMMFCSVPKVACTNWKRMLLVFEGATSLFNESEKSEIHKSSHNSFALLNKTERHWRQNRYYAFVFVRHPFERLFSAYRDKFLSPKHPAFQLEFGSAILRKFRANLTAAEYESGKNITFTEFLMFIIDTYKNRGYQAFDEHWQVMTKLCAPCSVKYDYLGQMSTLHEDADEILRQVGLVDLYTFPHNARDKHKHTATSLMIDFISKVPTLYLKQIYQIYKDDFEAFGFSPDTFVWSNNSSVKSNMGST